MQPTPSAGRVQVGVALPQTRLEGGFDPGPIHTFLMRAEALGFHSVWAVEQMLGSISSLEPIELLTYAAAQTNRVRLGVAVLLIGLRNPISLAKSLSTLDQLSRGRLIAGVGLGANPRVYPAFGLSPERRVARFRESLTVIKRLWTDERVTLDGDFFKLKNASMEPKPVQKPHPPIWFGGHHPDALARAVDMGDGFIGAGSASTDEFLEELRIVRDLVAASGLDRFALGKRVYMAIDSDHERALERLKRWFSAFYKMPEMAEKVCVWGTAADCVQQLNRITGAGVPFLLLNPVFDEMEHLELIASDIVPHLVL